jgi:DNA-binding response OmpR family regulator
LFIAGKPTILIIDDDTAILRVFTKIFQRKGYCVTVAEKGGEAIEKIRLHQYDIAVIDFCLPDMEGTELFSVIKNASPNTVKIMLTGKNLFQGKIEGADVLIGKPINPDKLLSVIESKLKSGNIEN